MREERMTKCKLEEKGRNGKRVEGKTESTNKEKSGKEKKRNEWK